jgi:hypothetical protein
MTYFWQNPTSALQPNPVVSVKALAEWFPQISREDAEVIVQHIRDAQGTQGTWQGSEGGREVDAALDLFNDEIDAHGVEAIRGDYHAGRYYYDIVALYVNTGDTYNPTLLYETDTGRFLLTSWGDWVEHNTRKYRIQ